MRNKVFIKKLELLLEFFRVILCLPIGCVLSLTKDILIVCERGTDARDNGYHFYKYLIEKQNYKNVYYIIDKKSADYHKVAKLGNVIQYKSWKHVLFYIAAKIKISTHIAGYAPGSPYYFQIFQRYIKIPGKHVFLQHGIIENDLVALYAENIYVDLFICGAKPEFDYVVNSFGHPKGVVQYTGLARYDYLDSASVSTKKEILIMPTWRNYLSNLCKEEFIKSEYYIRWNEILTSPELCFLLHKNNIKLYFYPHYEMQKFVDCFKPDDDNIIIADFNNFDVQQLLKDASLLITDYSSVFFDFAYMKKPCIYYQFDREYFYSKHYKKGYFDYYKDGFGDVTVTKEELLESVKHCFDSDFVMDAKYSQRTDKFFTLCDNHNCYRIYKAIEALK